MPIFAGFDLRRDQGRLFQYDVTGGRYEAINFASTGSGSLHAGTVIKLGFRDGLSGAQAIELALQALWQAADADSATGGPDLVRGIFPVVATISEAGFQRVEDGDIRTRFEAILADLTAQQTGGTEPSQGGTSA